MIVTLKKRGGRVRQMSDDTASPGIEREACPQRANLKESIFGQTPRSGDPCQEIFVR